MRKPGHSVYVTNATDLPSMFHEVQIHDYVDRNVPSLALRLPANRERGIPCIQVNWFDFCSNGWFDLYEVAPPI